MYNYGYSRLVYFNIVVMLRKQFLNYIFMLALVTVHDSLKNIFNLKLKLKHEIDLIRKY